jgi:hypothetical protein
MTTDVGLKFFGFSLEEVSKIIGGSVVALYLLGYIVLSFYFSTYGFGQTSPLRPRVLEAGVCCLVFTVLPLALGLAVEFIPNRNLSSLKIILLKIGILPILCDYLMSFPGLTGGIDYSNPIQMLMGTGVTVPVFLSLVIAGLFLLLLLVIWFWCFYHRHTMAVIIVIWSISFFVIRMHWHARQLPSSHIFFWFFGMALVGPFGSAVVDQTKATRDLASRREFIEDRENFISLSHLKTSGSFYRPISSVTSIALLVFIFVTWVYGVIPFRLGGGHPIAVVVALRRSGDSVRIIHGDLLDESERGYYLLLPQAQHAIFISREDVKFVSYNGINTTDISKLE